VARPRAAALRGRAAPARARAVHGRHRPGAEGRHAAILRSQLAHARITRLDPRPRSSSRASSASSRARTSSRCPGRSRSGSRPRRRTTRRPSRSPLRRRAARGRRRRDRYTAEDALELIEVDYEPLEPVLEPSGASRVRSILLVRRRRGAFAGPISSSRSGSTSRAGRARPVECYGVVADWDEAAGVLTAWANFQGPFTLHSVAAARSGSAARSCA
jgi:2-furoyl-CoA dehydrogenase large subunit